QSLPGMLYRLLTHSPSFLEEGIQPVGYYNLLNLEPSTVRWILKFAGLGFLGMLWWLCHRVTSAEQRESDPPYRHDWPLAIEYAIVVLGMLLFSERTWKHHCVTMLLPFGVLCYYLTAVRPSTGRSTFVIVSILIAQLLMASTSTSLWQP